MSIKKVTKGLPQPSLSFYSHKDSCIIPDIWTLLENGLWRDFDFAAFVDNALKPEIEQNRQIFKNYTPILPGFRWNDAHGDLVEDLYYPNIIETDKQRFLSVAEELFHSFDGKRLGVHLSGGLDSSIIICLLQYFGIPFYLAGLKSNRFEFRTERRIQELLAPKGQDCILLDLEKYPFYSDLDRIPKHQIPQSNIKMNRAHDALCEAFARMGVDVVFTGQGGDTLFVDAPLATSSFNIGSEFRFNWDEDFLYSPRGIELVSFYGCPVIIDQIYNLRREQKVDVLKKWARNFFADILPRELSQYCYVADFFGISMSGLNNAKATIKKLFEESFEITGNEIFSSSRTKQLIETNVFDLKYSTYIEYCTQISLAVWIYSLFREN